MQHIQTKQKFKEKAFEWIEICYVGLDIDIATDLHTVCLYTVTSLLVVVKYA